MGDWSAATASRTDACMTKTGCASSEGGSVSLPVPVIHKKSRPRAAFSDVAIQSDLEWPARPGPSWRMCFSVQRGCTGSRNFQGAGSRECQPPYASDCSTPEEWSQPLLLEEKPLHQPDLQYPSIAGNVLSQRVILRLILQGLRASRHLHF